MFKDYDLQPENNSTSMQGEYVDTTQPSIMKANSSIFQQQSEKWVTVSPGNATKPPVTTILGIVFPQIQESVSYTDSLLAQASYRTAPKVLSSGISLTQLVGNSTPE